MRHAVPLFFAAAGLLLPQTPGTNTKFSFTAPASLDEWKVRREAVKRQILWAAGLDPAPAKNPINPRTAGRIEAEGYTVENIAIETLPGFWLAGNLYRPANTREPMPAILHPHGHWKNGRLESTDECNSPALASALARGGAIVFAYDMVGYNDTLQLPHKFGLEKGEMLWSFGPLQVQLWNSVRVVDYLLSRNDVDPKRIGMTGASGGGSQTFLLAAIDDRIRAAAPVNMVSFIMQGGCECENATGLRIGTNNVEIAAITAPRPMLMVSATGDWTRNMLEEELPAVQPVYKLYDAADLVSAVRIDAPHNYNQRSRAAVYEFFNNHFGLKAGIEQEKPPADLSRLRLLNTTEPRLGAAGYEDVFLQWKARAMAHLRTATDSQLRDRLMRAFAAAVPLEQPAPKFIPGTGAPILFIGEDSAAPVKSGRPILIFQPSRTAQPLAPDPKDAKHVLAFNRSDAAQAVVEILASLKILREKAQGTIEIIAPGSARWPALFAAAVTDEQVAFKASPADYCYGDDCLAREFFVPSLQFAGGVDAAFRLLQGRR